MGYLDSFEKIPFRTCRYLDGRTQWPGSTCVSKISLSPESYFCIFLPSLLGYCKQHIMVWVSFSFFFFFVLPPSSLSSPFLVLPFLPSPYISTIPVFLKLLNSWTVTCIGVCLYDLWNFAYCQLYWTLLYCFYKWKIKFTKKSIPLFINNQYFQDSSLVLYEDVVLNEWSKSDTHCHFGFFCWWLCINIIDINIFLTGSL